MMMAIVVLALLPLARPTIMGGIMDKIHTLKYWNFIGVFVMLTWLGSMHVEEPFPMVSLVYTVWYFCYFISVLI